MPYPSYVRRAYEPNQSDHLKVKFQYRHYIVWLVVRTYMSSPESKFLEEMSDRDQYSGLWIAIFATQVIAQGKDVRVVYADAVKSTKGKTPLLVKIPDKNKEQTLIL